MGFDPALSSGHRVAQLALVLRRDKVQVQPLAGHHDLSAGVSRHDASRIDAFHSMNQISVVKPDLQMLRAEIHASRGQLVHSLRGAGLDGLDLAFRQIHCRVPAIDAERSALQFHGRPQFDPLLVFVVDGV